MNKDQLPANLRELIVSEQRSEILKVIFEQTGAFTCKEICDVLLKRGVDAKAPTVLFCLRALCYRGYAKEIPPKDQDVRKKGRGRPMVKYHLLWSVQL